MSNILQECLNCLELQQIYTLHTVGGEGGEKANEAILARGAMLAGEGTGGNEGLGNAQIQGPGAGEEDDDDDEGICLSSATLMHHITSLLAQ